MLKNTQLLSEKEAAKLLSLSRQTLANWRHLSKGPDYVRLGRRVLYPLTDLQAFIDVRKIRLNNE